MIDIQSAANCKVTLQSVAQTQDAAGGVVKAYKTVAQNVPAFQEQLTGREASLYGADRATRMWRFYFKPQADVSEGGRVIFGGRNGVIKAVNPVPEAMGMGNSHLVVDVEWQSNLPGYTGTTEPVGGSED